MIAVADMPLKEALISLCTLNAVDFEQLISPSRERTITDWRIIFLAAIAKHYGNYIPEKTELYNALGGICHRDRTSVYHAVKTATNISRFYPEYWLRLQKCQNHVLKIDQYLNRH